MQVIEIRYTNTLKTPEESKVGKENNPETAATPAESNINSSTPLESLF